MTVATQAPRMHRPRTSPGDTVDMVLRDGGLVLALEEEGEDTVMSI